MNASYVKNYNYFNESPSLSVVMPAYNCEKKIFFPILSIQNQNLTNFEIILINDFSQDNTYNMIYQLSKKDKRIKIINNKKNMGTLYSRCIGTLISKGEYIFPLDNDDMIFGEDIFDFTYKIAKKNTYDILGFKSVFSHRYSENIRNMKDLYKYIYPNNLIICQPKLRTWIITINGKFNPHDVTLWAKIINSKIYIQAINLLGKNRYSKYVSWAEDTSMIFIIFNIANSYIFVHKYGILHLSSSSSATSTQPFNNNFFGLVFWLEIIFDFSKKNYNKNYSVSAALYIMKNYYKNKSKINKANLSYFKNIINKIINSRYIQNDKKILLIKTLKKFCS